MVWGPGGQVGKAEHGPTGSPEEAGPITPSHTLEKRSGACMRVGGEDREDPGWTNSLPHTDFLALSTAALLKTERAQRALFSDPLPFTGTVIKTRPDVMSSIRSCFHTLAI